MQRAVFAVGGLDVNVQGHLTLICELDGVAQEIDYDLPQPVGISTQNVRHGRSYLAQKFQSFFSRPERHRLHRPSQTSAQVEIFQFQIFLSRLNLGEVENVIDYSE